MIHVCLHERCQRWCYLVDIIQMVKRLTFQTSHEASWAKSSQRLKTRSSYKMDDGYFFNLIFTDNKTFHYIIGLNSVNIGECCTSVSVLLRCFSLTLHKKERKMIIFQSCLSFNLINWEKFFYSIGRYY